MSQSNVDRRDFVVTHDRVFDDSSRLREFTGTDTEYAPKGIEFGVGRGNDPISWFPGSQNLVRPIFSPDRCLAIDVDDLMRNLAGVRGQLKRATARVGFGTDLSVLRYIFSDEFRAMIAADGADNVELVLSSSSPNQLRALKSKGIKADVWQ
ncbi:MAG: hypothetical protein US89_C0008G0025 [Candidatus Peregrinibacteria bacterium GW2011_GWF2_38_29]|nr:MAG: hypothetical protein US89_C0008G0025 [Candidatus Peregrinibacteria bacterium GW2011_GWF2_38_29]HBB03164.1 hypothetical protein [Candidatus Peregrinibacteria bacterium]